MISIIIPVYNQPKELDKCLNSISKQTYDNYEVILVNDRSTKRMSRVVLPYKKIIGHKLKIYNNQTNHGAPYSRNKGYKKSRGEFLLFCDADIIMKEKMLEVMIHELHKNKDISYAYSSHKYGGKTFRCFPFDAKRLKAGPFIHSTSLIRREHFPASGWDESLMRLQDWDLWLTMLEEGRQGIWIDRVLFKVQKGGTMSVWRPKLMYKVFPFLPEIKKYHEAVRIVKEKHNISI